MPESQHWRRGVFFFSDCFYNIYLEKVPCDKTENEKKKQQQPQEADSNSLHPPLSTELTAAVIKKSFGGEMCLWSIIFNYPIQKYQVWNSRKASVKARPVTLKLAVVLEGKHAVDLKDKLTWALCRRFAPLYSLYSFHIVLIVNGPPRVAVIVSTAVFPLV